MNPDGVPSAGAAQAGGPGEIDLHYLLGRPPLPFDETSIAGQLAGKRVLVTGAGGSIGTRLARRLSDWGTGEIVFVDSHENSLYELQVQMGTDRHRSYRLADIRRCDETRRLLLQHRPEVLFHLAAYKHVPLGEENPGQVIVTNVLGTLNVARAAAEAGVGTLVYPSTDKAVYPPSVYGASKRVAELLLRALAREVASPRLVIVRLVNAVGAQGGVIRLFARQIAEGKPLTLTHEGMIRYWISIDEAALLLAQASCADKGGQVLAPDVGPPLRLTAVASRMQQILRPGVEPAIAVTGMRPGERLTEVLVRDDEVLTPCRYPGVLSVQDRSENRPSLAEMLEAVARFERRLAAGDEDGLRRDLFDLVRD